MPQSTSKDTCYRHPDRVAGVSCQRCDRPICPSCMVQASVGFHCPDCAGQRRSKVVTGRAAFGGGSRDPIATKVIIGLNVAVYVWMVVRSGEPTRASGPVFEWGATFGPFIAAGDWYRLVSGAFLHSGVMHLGMNMFLLWLLGQVMEPALGRINFVLVYVVSMLGGSLGVMLLDPGSPTVGASGAVFGLMGALVVLQLRAGQSPWRSGIGTLVVLNLVITFALPGVSVGGHVGGLLAGALAAFGFSASQGLKGVTPAVRIGALAAMAVLLAVAGVVAAQQAFPLAL